MCEREKGKVKTKLNSDVPNRNNISSNQIKYTRKNRFIYLTKTL